MCHLGMPKYEIPHSLLQVIMDAQVMKLYLQPDTSFGFPSTCDEDSIGKDTPELVQIPYNSEKDEASNS